MHSMQRQLILTLILSLVLALVGCATQKDDSGPEVQVRGQWDLGGSKTSGFKK